MSSSYWVVDYSVIVRIFLSLVLGGLVGLEREIHGRPAGLRTHVMVCLGAAILLLSSELSQKVLEPGIAKAVFDPDRIAAGIITGIGFLGAGAIMREGNLVRGLTTAGSIWFVAGLGIVIGKKFYGLALCSTLAAITVLVLFRYMENWVSVMSFRPLVIQVGIKSFESVRGECRTLFQNNGLYVDEKHLTIDHTNNEIEIKYTLKLKKGDEKEPMVLEISRLPGVKKVAW